MTRSTQTQICDVNSAFTKVVNDSHNPLSYDLIDSTNQHNNELSLTKSRLFSIHKHYKKLKWRFHQLHEDYQKMNEIAAELTLALENSVRGHPVDLEAILQSCMKIFPERFDRDIQTDSEVFLKFMLFSSISFQ